MADTRRKDNVWIVTDSKDNSDISSWPQVQIAVGGARQGNQRPLNRTQGHRARHAQLTHQPLIQYTHLNAPSP